MTSVMGKSNMTWQSNQSAGIARGRVQGERDGPGQIIAVDGGLQASVYLP
jgi:hypothetical protein